MKEKNEPNKPTAEARNGTTTATLLPPITAGSEAEGVRIDAFASERGGLTRSAAVRLIERGEITVNGGAVKKNYKLNAADTVVIALPAAVPDEAVPEDIPLDVVYEDEDIIVVNKPVGMVVHPAAGNRGGTLVNALLARCGDTLSGIGGVERPGIVHRIDKDTSGLIAAAKNDSAHLSLSAQLADHSMRRIYDAVTVGALKDDYGTINAPIGRCPTDRKRMAVLIDTEKRTRAAVTHYTVTERYAGFTRVTCKLETGRTHQIRVHMSYIGHPLLGDAVYGGGHTRFERENAALLHGQLLHAGELTLTHPKSGQRMTFTCSPPTEFIAITEKLRKITDGKI